MQSEASLIGTTKIPLLRTNGSSSGALSNAGRRWRRNPDLISYGHRRRCIPTFSSSYFSSSPSNNNNNTPSRNGNTPDAYKDSGYLPADPPEKDLDDDSGGDLEIEIEIEETGNNRRRIQSKVSVEASLQTVWNILTDYERLADFIPGLAVSKLLHKGDNFARLFQIGEQNLAFGLKFKAKGVIDCYEKDLQKIPLGQRRDIEFKMIEGDFQLFQGKWSVEQINIGEYELGDSALGPEFHTTLSYIVDVKPKVWLPVRLVQGRLCQEIKLNLLCIKKAAQTTIQNKVSSY